MDTNLKIVYVQRSGISAPNGTIGSQIYNPNDTATYIQDGQIVVTNPFGKVLTTADTTEKEIQIRARQGDTVYCSATIPVNKITSYVVSTYRPETEKVSIIGYDGSNNLPFTTILTTGATYSVSLWREDDDFYMGVDRPKSAQYVQGTNPLLATIAATDKQGEIVLGLADFIYKEFIKTITGYTQVDLPIKVEVLSDGTYGTTNSGWLVGYESDIITKTAHGLTSTSVGKACRIGASNATTTGVYVIKQIIDANTVLIDRAFQGTGGTLNVYIATVAPTYWGLKLTGNRKIFATGLWAYRKARFQVQPNLDYINGVVTNYGVGYTALNTKGWTTTTTNVVAAGTLIANADAYNGVGVAPLVKEAEWKSLGFHGVEKQYRLSPDREILNRQLVSNDNGVNCTYSILNLEWKKQYTDITISTINDSGNVIVAIPVTFNTTAATMTETVATAATYGFVAVLDAITTAGVASPQLTKVTTY